MAYKVMFESIPWECECCGCGAHGRVTVFIGDDIVKRWSCDDKFGGTLGDSDLDFPEYVYDYEAFAKGLYEGIFISGAPVFYEDHK